MILTAVVLLTLLFTTNSFVSTSLYTSKSHLNALNNLSSPHRAGFMMRQTTKLAFFGGMFDEEGPLGKGITVGQVSVCLRSGLPMINKLNTIASCNSGTSPTALSKLASETALALLRAEDDWISACGRKSKYAEKDAGKAESDFNRMATKLASKYEKEYPPTTSSTTTSSSSSSSSPSPSVAVVTLLLEITGDSTPFEIAGKSISQTKESLQSIAADVGCDGGRVLNGVEIFWCPGDKSEVLEEADVLLDFPELISL